MKSNVRNILIALLAVVVVVGVCVLFFVLRDKQEPSGGSDTIEASADTTDGTGDDRVPDFTVYTEDGERVTLYEKEGKPVVLNFWATWCPPCKAEMPAYNALYAEYGDEIEFMMINLTDGERETVEGVKEFLSENGYTFPVYYDMSMNAASVYGVNSIPLSVFIDSEGVLVDHHLGTMDEETLRGYLEELKGE